MIRYKTVAKSAFVEQVIERSRFIGYIAPAESREEAGEFIRTIRKKHYDATHNVPAFVIGEQSEIQWASDDGEPSGTSGAPVLHYFTGEGITNTVIVITRYFGGTKLGTGGLVRAYSSTARMAVQEAGLYEVREMDRLTFKMDYSYLGKIQSLAQEDRFRIAETVYEDRITLSLLSEPENTAAVLTLLSELTGGKLQKEQMEIRREPGKAPVRMP